jgi:ribosomal protein S18 acetylase RimI-like enzyme
VIAERRNLAATDLDAIAALEHRVVEADGGRLKLEWSTLRQRSGEEADDLLWWDGDRLLGFLGLYPFGGPLELAGMVDPAARRRGIGTALVRRGLALAAGRGVARVLLVVARTTPAGAAFAASLGGALEHSEHSLVLRAPPAGAPRLEGVSLRPARPDEARLVASLLASGFGEGHPEPEEHDPFGRRLVVELDGTVVGTLRVDLDRGTGVGAAGIYGFVVEPGRRGLGIGREALRQACAELFERGCSEVSLEVAVDNEHALGLYTSVGFVRRATEDYYALDTGLRLAVRD